MQRSLTLSAPVCFGYFDDRTYVAHVATKDIAFGLCRMWEILSDETKWEIMVFRNREDAEAWIMQKVKDKCGIGDLTFG